MSSRLDGLVMEDVGDDGEVVKAKMWVKDGFVWTKTPIRDEAKDIGDGKQVEAKYTARTKGGGRVYWLNGNFGTISLLSKAESGKSAAPKAGSKAKGKTKPKADDEDTGEPADD